LHKGTLIFSRKKTVSPNKKTKTRRLFAGVFFWARNDLVFNLGYDQMVIGNGYDQTSHASRHFHNFPIEDKYTTEQFRFFLFSAFAFFLLFTLFPHFGHFRFSPAFFRFVSAV